MQNRYNAISFAYSYTFIRIVVCLSVVCLSHSHTLLKSLDGLPFDKQA